LRKQALDGHRRGGLAAPGSLPSPAQAL